jgi:pheromone shutdown protein TraB
MVDTPKATIKIVGTSHIASESAKHIRRVYDSFQPDFIAVELDRRRLISLQEQAAGAKDRGVPFSLARQIGITGYLFIKIGKAAQQKLGSIVKVDPGVDMLAAVNIAREHKKELFLVDQDIMITMRHLSRQFTFKEKMRVVWDIVSSPFSKKMRKLNFDLRKVPDDKTLEFMMNFMKDRYPSLYNVMVIERNIVMARNLDAIVRKHPGKKILLVIGKGHEEDLRRRLALMERIAAVE